jgi:hypothetical protein
MHPGNISSSSGRLQEALEQLQLAWSATSDVWRDSQSENVRVNHLEPMAREVTIALPAISHLLQVIAQAKRELDE